MNAKLRMNDFHGTLKMKAVDCCGNLIFEFYAFSSDADEDKNALD